MFCYHNFKNFLPLVIQHINTIIAPYRVVRQNVLPVQEDIQTNVPRAAAPVAAPVALAGPGPLLAAGPGPLLAGGHGPLLAGPGPLLAAGPGPALELAGPAYGAPVAPVPISPFPPGPILHAPGPVFHGGYNLPPPSLHISPMPAGLLGGSFYGGGAGGFGRGLSLRGGHGRAY